MTRTNNNNLEDTTMAASQALSTRPKQEMTRPHNPVAALTVQFPRDRYNVLAPTTHMESLPEGTRLVVTEVKIDPNGDWKNKAREVFPIGGGGLLVGKQGLNKIAQAAGISWIEERRVDDRRSPHYVEMLVRGQMTDFDGTVRFLTGIKSIDLREDAGGGIPGKDYEAMVEAAKTGKNGPRDPTNQIREARKFITEIAAAKAKNRAIADGLAIKRSYSAEELQKPFIVPKLVLDPSHGAARELIMANAAGATAALFAARAQPPVMDATFEEPEQPVATMAAGEEEGVDVSSKQAAPSSNNDDQPGSPEVLAKMRALWAKASERGMDAATFKGICQVQTGKAKKEEMTLADTDEVESACAAYFANSDGMPV